MTKETAMKILKELHGKSLFAERTALETLIPELKESEDERVKKRILLSLEKDLMATKNSGCDTQDLEQCIAWFEKQGTSAKLSEEEQNKFAKGVLSSCALSFIDYLDAHSYEGKMCVSNGECEDIENAFHNAMWDRLHRYYCKYIEKQGEQKPIMNVPTREVILSIWDLGNEWKELTNGSISTEYGTQLDYIQKHWYESEYYLREKQGEQNPILGFKASNWYVSKVDGKIHDMTYNPADKVEPKFKIGDYIVSDYCVGRVVEITSDAYLLDIGQGIPFSCEDKVHLWTIADANEGNILAGKIDGDNYILIFKTVKDGWIETYGHYYNAVDRFCVPSQLFCRSYQGTFAPATKEQRDTLMKAMADAGWKFDFDKKELKKIEDEIEIPFGAKDSELQEETYYIPKGFHAEIDDDKVVIKRGEKPAAWNVEDSSKVQRICKYLDEAKKYYADITEVRECIDWLKSLKDRIGGLL